VIGSLLLPPWHIYCLIAVCSLYRLMEKKEMGERYVVFYLPFLYPLHLLYSLLVTFLNRKKTS
jgi:hypothetical protein